MPAAAVIPAPVVYIKVVAVKKLVVGFPGYLGVGCGHLNCGHAFSGGCALLLGGHGMYFEQIRVLKTGDFLLL